MQQSDYLDLIELKERLGVSYGVLRRFHEAEGVADFLGAVDVPGVKGRRYPLDSEPLWRALVEAYQQKLVTPTTAAAWLRRQQSAEGNAAMSLSSGGIIAPLSQRDSARAIVEALRSIEGLLRSSIAPDDALIPIKSAHTEYGLSYKDLAAGRVKYAGRWVVSRNWCRQRVADVLKG